MQTLSENLVSICCVLLKIVCLLVVFLIVWYFIATLTGVINILDLVGIDTYMTQQSGRISLMITGLFMIICYLPLCNFVKSLFPSISSSKYRDHQKLVVLIFYIFILVTSIPIINQKMNMPRRSLESEAKQYVGSMNRAQQAIFEEKNAFATSVDALGLGIKTETKNYKYSVYITKQAAFHYGVSKHEEVKSYIGGVFLRKSKQNNKTDKITTESILCRADQRGTITPLPPTIENGKVACGSGTKVVKPGGR